MKKLLLSFVAIIMCQAIMAQAPQWKSGYFKELSNSYIDTASGSARSVDEARNKAASEIIRKRDMATGASARVVNGQVTVSGDVVVKSRVLDEYVEHDGNGMYTVYLLTQTAKHPDNTLEPVMVSDQYPFSAMSFVPGMQQIYKGQKTKGLVFIIAEAASIGGIIYAESMRANNENLIGSTHNAQLRTQYTDATNNWANIRNGAIAAAAVVYVWNVVDAVVGKGARYVKVGDAAFTMLPYATSESAGFALNIKF